MKGVLRCFVFASFAAASTWAAGCLVTFEDYPAGSLDGGGGSTTGGAGGAGGASGASGVAGNGGGGGSAGAQMGGAAGSDGGEADGSTADATIDAGGCPSGLLPISDDFEDGDLSTGQKWIALTLGLNVIEAGGHLDIGWPSPAEAGWAGAVVSQEHFDLRNCAALVELIHVPAPGNGATVRFAIEPSTDNGYDIIAIDGQIIARRVVSGVIDQAQTSYDSVKHRWLRLRESGGMFHWETSPDGASWVQLRAAEPTWFDLASVRLVVGGISDKASSFAGYARFDNVNLPP